MERQLTSINDDPGFTPCLFYLKVLHRLAAYDGPFILSLERTVYSAQSAPRILVSHSRIRLTVKTD